MASVGEPARVAQLDAADRDRSMAAASADRTAAERPAALGETLCDASDDGAVDFLVRLGGMDCGSFAPLLERLCSRCAREQGGGEEAYAHCSRSQHTRQASARSAAGRVLTRGDDARSAWLPLRAPNSVPDAPRRACSLRRAWPPPLVLCGRVQ